MLLVSATAHADPAAPTVSVTTAMRFDGAVDAARLVAALRTQVARVQPCMALVRRTDRVVGSLNLRVMVSRSGAVTTRLESPVNPAASECILAATRTWRAPRVGAGTAMVLLTITDADADAAPR